MEGMNENTKGSVTVPLKPVASAIAHTKPPGFPRSSSSIASNTAKSRLQSRLNLIGAAGTCFVDNANISTTTTINSSRSRYYNTSSCSNADEVEVLPRPPISKDYRRDNAKNSIGDVAVHNRSTDNTATEIKLEIDKEEKILNLLGYEKINDIAVAVKQHNEDYTHSTSSISEHVSNATITDTIITSDKGVYDDIHYLSDIASISSMKTVTQSVLQQSGISSSVIFAHTRDLLHSIEEKNRKTEADTNARYGSNLNERQDDEYNVRESLTEFKSHINMNERLIIGGWDAIVNELAIGQLEYCYLKPYADNPYRFRITGLPASMTVGTYATLSRHGFVRFIDGEVEYCSLSQFSREHHIYNQLKQVPIFRQYRQWKAINKWRKAFQQDRYNRIRLEIQSKLFHADLHLQSYLLKISSSCDTIRSMPMVHISLHQCYGVHTFFSSQSSVQDECMLKRHQVIQKLVAYLRDESEAYTEKAMENMPITITMRQHLINQDKKTLNVGSSVDSRNHKKDESMPLSYTERSSIRHFCRRFASVLRLSDFMLRDRCYECVELSLTYLCDHLTGSCTDAMIATSSSNSASISKYTNNRSSAKYTSKGIVSVAADASDTVGSGAAQQRVAFIEVKVEMSDDDCLLIMNPEPAYAVEYFKDALSEYLKLACHADCILSRQDFSQSLLPIAQEIGDIELIDRVYSDKSCSLYKLQSVCVDLLGNDLQASRDLLDTEAYSKWSRRYEHNTNLLSTMSISTLSTMSVEEVECELDRLDTEYAESELLPLQLDVGLIRLKIDVIRVSAQSSILAYKALLHHIIPEWYILVGEKLYTIAYALISCLGSRPSTIVEFVKMFDAYNTAINSNEIGQYYEEIMNIRDLFDTYDIHQSDDTLRQNSTITNVWFQFKDLLSSFEGEIDAYMKEFTRELKGLVAIALQPVKDAQVYLQGDAVMKPSSDADEMISELKRYSYLMEVVDKKSVELLRYQEILKVVLFTSDLLKATALKVRNFLLLWNQMKIVRCLDHDISHAGTLVTCDCAAATGKLRLVVETLMRIEVDENNRSVHCWLTDKVDELKKVTSCVGKLKSNTLRRRHVEYLNKIFKQNIYALAPVAESDDNSQDGISNDADDGSDDSCDVQNTVTTVRQLIEFGLFSYLDEIDAVYKQSLYEDNVHRKFTLLKHACYSQDFDFQTDRDNKSLYYISNFSTIDDLLHDITITMDSCLQSQFCTLYRHGMTAFKECLMRWMQAFELMKTLQDGYLQLRVIFTSARTARHLHSNLRYFKVVDDIYRSVLKVAKDEVSITKVLDTSDLMELLNEGNSAILSANEAIVAYIDTQRSKWVKLYLISKSSLIEALGMQDPRKTFQKCRALFPSITDVAFDKNDITATVAVWSGCEKVKLGKISSARSALVDWLKGIDSGLTETMVFDAKHAIENDDKDIVELIKKYHQIDSGSCVATSEQGRLCRVHVGFWSNLSKNVLRREYSNDSTFNRSGVTDMMKQLSVEMQSLTSLMTPASTGNTKNSNSKSSGNSNSNSKGTTGFTTYQMQTIHNTLILLISQRDMLSHILTESDSTSMLTFHLSIKKFWNPLHSTLQIKHGAHTLAYGFKYQGFSARLVMTPLTDKCLLSLHSSMQQGTMPCMYGGSAGKMLFKSLAAHCGVDANYTDCSIATKCADIVNIVKATFETSTWQCFYNVDAMEKSMLSVLMTALSSLHDSAARNADRVVLGSRSIAMSDELTSPYKVCLSFTQSPHSLPVHLPASIRNIFRPVHTVNPDVQVVISTLLQAHTNIHTTALASRLRHLLDYLSTMKSVRLSVLNSLLIHSIKCLKSVAVAPGEQLNFILASFLSLIPSHVQEGMQLPDIPLIAHMFAEAANADMIRRLMLTSSTDVDATGDANITDRYTNTLKDMILNTSYSSAPSESTLSSVILVVGINGCGKTSTITAAVDAAVSQHNSSIDRRISVTNNYMSMQATQQQSRVMRRYEHMINPYVMATLQHSDGPAHVALEQAAYAVMKDVIDGIDPYGPIVVLHIDVASSREISNLLNRCTCYASATLKAIIFVWECTELQHVDVGILDDTCIMHVSEKVGYSNDPSYITSLVKRLFVSQDSHFTTLLTYCCDLYTVPYVAHAFPNGNSTGIVHSLIESQLRLFNTISTYLYSNSNAFTSLQQHENPPYDEVSFQRIFLFSCIWTFGVISHAARGNYESWLRDYVDKLSSLAEVRSSSAAAAGISNLSPVSKASRQNNYSSINVVAKPILGLNSSIFDFILHKANEDDTHVNWATFKYNFIDVATSESNARSSSVAVTNYCTSRVYQSSIPDYYYSGVYGPQQSSLLIPTSTGDALSFIQSAMTAAHGGCIFLSGSPGCGISSLIRQLNIAKLHDSLAIYDDRTNKTCKLKVSRKLRYRWTCRSYDCTSQKLRTSLVACKDKISSSLIERNIPSLGTIIIEDVSISGDAIDSSCLGQSSSCLQLLGYINEHRCDYNGSTKKWDLYEGTYSLVSVKNYYPASSNSLTNTGTSPVQRFARRALCVELPDSDTFSVFTSRLCHTFPSIKEGISDDIVLITMKMVEHLKEKCRATPCNAEKDKYTFNKAVTNGYSFYQHFMSRSNPSICDNILSSIIAALSSMELFTGNDTIRVWDRIFVDYVSNCDAFEMSINGAIDSVLDGNIYRYPSFAEHVSREKMKRIEMQAKLHQCTSMNASTHEHYSSGFFKNEQTAFIGIQSADHAKSSVMLDSSCSRYSPDSTSIDSCLVNVESPLFWLDAQRLASEFTSVSGTGARIHTLLLGDSYTILSTVVCAACELVKAKRYTLHLNMMENDLTYLGNEVVAMLVHAYSNAMSTFYAENATYPGVKSGVQPPTALPLNNDTSNSSSCSGSSSSNYSKKSTHSSEVIKSLKSLCRVCHVHVSSSMSRHALQEMLTVFDFSHDSMMRQLCALSHPGSDVQSDTVVQAAITAFVENLSFVVTFESITVQLSNMSILSTSALASNTRVINASCYSYSTGGHRFVDAGAVVCDSFSAYTLQTIDDFMKFVDPVVHVGDSQVYHYISSQEFRAGTAAAVASLFGLSMRDPTRWNKGLSHCSSTYSTKASSSDIHVEGVTESDDEVVEKLFCDALYLAVFCRYLQALPERQHASAMGEVARLISHLPRHWRSRDVLPKLPLAYLMAYASQSDSRSISMDASLHSSIEKIVSLIQILPDAALTAKRVFLGIGINFLSHSNSISSNSASYTSGAVQVVDRSVMLSNMIGCISSLIGCDAQALQLPCLSGFKEVGIVHTKCVTGVSGCSIPAGAANERIPIIVVAHDSNLLNDMLLIYLLTKGCHVDVTLNSLWMESKRQQQDALSRVKVDSDPWNMSWSVTCDVVKNLTKCLSLILQSTMTVDASIADLYWHNFEDSLLKLMGSGTDTLPSADASLYYSMSKSMVNCLLSLQNNLSSKQYFQLTTSLLFKLCFADVSIDGEARTASFIDALATIDGPLGFHPYVDDDHGHVTSTAIISASAKTLLNKCLAISYDVKLMAAAGGGGSNSGNGLSSTNSNAIYNMICSDQHEWAKWASDPLVASVPFKYQEKMTSLDKVIVAYALKPAVLPAMVTAAIIDLASRGQHHQHTYTDMIDEVGEAAKRKMDTYNSKQQQQQCKRLLAYIERPDDVSMLDGQLFIPTHTTNTCGALGDDTTALVHSITDSKGIEPLDMQPKQMNIHVVMLNSSTTTSRTFYRDSVTIPGLRDVGVGVGSVVIDTCGPVDVARTQLGGAGYSSTVVETSRLFSQRSFTACLHDSIAAILGYKANAANDGIKPEQHIVSSRIFYSLAVYHACVLSFMQSRYALLGADTFVSVVQLADTFILSGDKRNGIDIKTLSVYVNSSIYYNAVTNASDRGIIDGLLANGFMLPKLLKAEMPYDIHGVDVPYMLRSDVSHAFADGIAASAFASASDSGSKGTILSYLRCSNASFQRTFSRSYKDSIVTSKALIDNNKLFYASASVSMSRSVATAGSKGQDNNHTLLMTMKSSIRKLQSRLPSKIDIESQRIASCIKKCNKLYCDSQASIAHRVAATSQKLTTADGSRNVQGSKYKSSSKHTEQSAKNDPIIKYILSEAMLYNDTLNSYNHIFKSLLHFSIAPSDCMPERTRGMMVSIVTSVESNNVPPIWSWRQQYNDCGGSNSHDVVSIDEWVIAFASRRELLLDWLENGYPLSLSLHNLQAPSLLLHAVRENHAFKHGKDLQEVSIQFSILDTANDSNKMIKGYKAAACSTSDDIYILSDVKLYNGIVAAGVLKPLPAERCSHFGHAISLSMRAVHTDQQPGNAEYACPLHQISNLPPTNVSIDDIISDRCDDSRSRICNSEHLLIGCVKIPICALSSSDLTKSGSSSSSSSSSSSVSGNNLDVLNGHFQISNVVMHCSRHIDF